MSMQTTGCHGFQIVYERCFSVAYSGVVRRNAHTVIFS